MNDNLAYEKELREELIGGKVVAMSPAGPMHNRLALKIAVLFENYLKGRTCVPFGDGTEVRLTEDDHFIPDGMVVCDRDKIKSKWVEGAPDLVWEILSPSTARNDKWFKRNAYETAGVPEYWIVNPREKSIEVYLLAGGRDTLDNIYFYYTPEERAEMTEEELAEAVEGFKCHLYDDLTIRLEDIFCDIL